MDINVSTKAEMKRFSRIITVGSWCLVREWVLHKYVPVIKGIPCKME